MAGRAWQPPLQTTCQRRQPLHDGFERKMAQIQEDRRPAQGPVSAADLVYYTEREKAVHTDELTPGVTPGVGAVKKPPTALPRHDPDLVLLQDPRSRKSVRAAARLEAIAVDAVPHVEVVADERGTASGASSRATRHLRRFEMRAREWTSGVRRLYQQIRCLASGSSRSDVVTEREYTTVEVARKGNEYVYTRGSGTVRVEYGAS